jgi:hypothetical protein
MQVAQSVGASYSQLTKWSAAQLKKSDLSEWLGIAAEGNNDSRAVGVRGVKYIISRRPDYVDVDAMRQCADLARKDPNDSIRYAWNDAFVGLFQRIVLPESVASSSPSQQRDYRLVTPYVAESVATTMAEDTSCGTRYAASSAFCVVGLVSPEHLNAEAILKLKESLTKEPFYGALVLKQEAYYAISKNRPELLWTGEPHVPAQLIRESLRRTLRDRIFV